MKKMIKFAAFAALAMVCVSCTLDADKFEYGKNVLAMSGTSESTLVKMSVGDNPPASYSVTVSATDKVENDATVTLLVGDEDALAAYNQSHGTSFQPVPASAFSVSSSTVKIAAGTAVSEACVITLNDFAFIQNGVQYMIPVSVADVAGTDFEVLESSRTIYIRLARTISFFALDISTPSLSSNYIFADDKKIELKNYTYEVKCYPTNLKHEGAEQLCRLCNWTGAKEERQNMLRFNENGRPWRSLQIVTPSGGDYTTTTLFEENQWYMLSMVYDGTSYQLYINGEPDATVLQGDQSTAFQRFELGMSYQGYNSSQLFSGRICEVRVWDYARSKSQINGGMCGVDPSSEGLRAYWKFNDASGHIFKDATGNGYDMDWSQSQRAISGNDLSPTPDCGNVAEGRWVKDEINTCSE